TQSAGILGDVRPARERQATERFSVSCLGEQHMDAATTAQIAASTRRALERLCDRHGAVPKELAQRLIANSTIWLSHKDGPCLAPSYADRVESDSNTWQIAFGANSILVANAVRRCRRIIEDAIVRWEAGSPIEGKILREQLRRSFQSSVKHKYEK